MILPARPRSGITVFPRGSAQRDHPRRFWRWPTTCVDLLVVGSGTGMAAALTAHELGLSVLIVEKSSQVGGSTARSGGALWLPASPVLREGRRERHRRPPPATYLEAVVAGSAPPQRSVGFVSQVSAMVDMLRRTTPLRLFLGLAIIRTTTPRKPGGSAAGRTCELPPAGHLDSRWISHPAAARRAGGPLSL